MPSKSSKKQISFLKRNKFYQNILSLLQKENIPFLVGGAFALNHYTGIKRMTKDLDLFIHPSDIKRISKSVRQAGFDVDMKFSNWVGKIYEKQAYIDVIFNSGNGLSEVDELWFQYAKYGEINQVPVKICPVEETIWTKAFIMERERFDGADVVHLIHACAKDLDWERLLWRFGENWPVLLVHLILFSFIYPTKKSLIPQSLLKSLLDRFKEEPPSSSSSALLCRGTLLSRWQYIIDIEKWGYADPRPMMPD